jgi:hypothetical protein
MSSFLYFEEFSSSEAANLEDQGISLDDWDYALITNDLDLFEEGMDCNVIRDSSGEICDEEVIRYLAPKSYTLSRVLNGCCDNTWTKIMWEGKLAIIGVAYHG